MILAQVNSLKQAKKAPNLLGLTFPPSFCSRSLPHLEAELLKSAVQLSAVASSASVLHSLCGALVCSPPMELFVS